MLSHSPCFNLYLFPVGFESNVKLRHLNEQDQVLIIEMRLSITEITKILWIQTDIIKGHAKHKKGVVIESSAGAVHRKKNIIFFH